MSDLQWRKELGAVIGLGAAVAVFFWPAATLQGAFFVQDGAELPLPGFFRAGLTAGKAAAVECGDQLWFPPIC